MALRTVDGANDSCGSGINLRLLQTHNFSDRWPKISCNRPLLLIGYACSLMIVRPVVEDPIGPWRQLSGQVVNRPRRISRRKFHRPAGRCGYAGMYPYDRLPDALMRQRQTGSILPTASGRSRIVQVCDRCARVSRPRTRAARGSSHPLAATFARTVRNAGAPNFYFQSLN